VAPVQRREKLEGAIEAETQDVRLISTLQGQHSGSNTLPVRHLLTQLPAPVLYTSSAPLRGDTNAAGVDATSISCCAWCARGLRAKAGNNSGHPGHRPVFPARMEAAVALHRSFTAPPISVRPLGPCGDKLSVSSRPAALTPARLRSPMSSAAARY